MTRRAVVAGVIACGAVVAAIAVKLALPVRPEGLASPPALCAKCHVTPSPDILPRFAWRDVIDDMYGLAGLPPDPAVVAWYEARAPERYDVRRRTLPSSPLKFTKRSLAPRDAPPLPGISNVRLEDLFGDARPELIACDMRHGLVMVGKPYDPAATTLEVVGQVPNPAHAEVVDLDRDGQRDLVVANLGSWKPGDHDQGSVVWLRRRKGAGFEPVTLASGLGRVADVEAADFDGDGDLDLVVAEFGWRATGRVLLLENRGPDAPWAVHVVDPRHGAIHVPVADLDGDGRPDFVALFAQEHEAVVAFLNRGGLRFEARELYRAPHPAWGSSGIELVDLDKDGDLDVLVTNGDTLDDHILKPYQGIRWLENVGGMKFVPHALFDMYGVHRAEAADLDGDGALDVVACAFLPNFGAEIRGPLGLESLVVLRGPSFEPAALETLACDHATLATGDWDQDGDVDIAVGNMTVGAPIAGWVDLWTNDAR